ncbi:MAG: response regulator [Candidatus Methanoperedens sp.]|nr:response regulator [Candidatus Methanoperedens sp.]
MGKKIMVVDDEPDTVDLVKLVLETEGFDVITAYSGSECLKKLEEEKVDAVLLDIMMPEMDGWEVFKKIKEKYEDLPVAMLTVRNQDIDKMLGLHVLKANDYITKPFGRKELVERVKKLVET